jgi:hypothetical protein
VNEYVAGGRIGEEAAHRGEMVPDEDTATARNVTGDSRPMESTSASIQPIEQNP